MRTIHARRGGDGLGGGGDGRGRGLGLDAPRPRGRLRSSAVAPTTPDVPARRVPAEAPAMTDKGVPMKRTRRIATLSLVLSGTLLASACGGGGGFEDDGASSSPASASGPVDLKMLIASSGDAETNAVKAATDAWAKSTGNTVTVTVASDMPQQLAQGFASGNPAGRRLHGRRPVRQLRQAGQPLPVRRPDRGQRRLLRVTAPGLHVRRASSTACPRTSPRSPCRSTPTRGPRPGCPTRTSPRPGRSSRQCRRS